MVTKSGLFRVNEQRLTNRLIASAAFVERIIATSFPQEGTVKSTIPLVSPRERGIISVPDELKVVQLCAGPVGTPRFGHASRLLASLFLLSVTLLSQEPVEIESNNLRPIGTMSFPHNVAYLNNDIKAFLDEIQSMLKSDSLKVVIIVGCSDRSERDGEMLSQVRSAAAGSFLSQNLDPSRMLLRACDTPGESSVYLGPANAIPSNRDLKTHDVNKATFGSAHYDAPPDYTLRFRDGSASSKDESVFEQIAHDSQANITHGYVLSASCSFREDVCSEAKTISQRLSEVRRTLIQLGVDSRRIVDGWQADGTASVKVFIKDINNDVRFVSARSISQDLPNKFLDERLKNLESTLPNEQFRALRDAFNECKSVAVVLYPSQLAIGWGQPKATVRVLVGKLEDPEFESRLQGLDVRKYLPYACLYGDTKKFPQFPEPPVGISVTRLKAFSGVRNVVVSSFVFDTQIGDSTGQGGSFVDQSWVVAPSDSDPHSMQVALGDGTVLPVPIQVDKQESYYLKRFWTVIVALAGVGVFGAISKVMGFFKKTDAESNSVRRRTAKSSR